MERIKILQVVGNLKIGGAENVAMNLLRYMNLKKFQCDFLVFDETETVYTKEARLLGAKIITIPKPQDNYYVYYQNLKKVLMENNYDVVHSHLMLNNGIVMKAAKGASIKKRVSHSHSTHSGKEESFSYSLYSKMMRYLILKNATDLVACGRSAGDFLYGNKNFEKYGIIVNNGINILDFQPDSQLRNEMRASLGIKSEIVVGHVGRFASVKNHKFLLEIYSEFVKIEPNSKLLLVGDGELRDFIEKRVKELGLENNVILTGMRSDIPSIFQCIDIFIFPSLYEGMPVTLVEAQASGVLCMVSNRITEEIKVTDLVNFESLDSNPRIWAERALEKYLEKKVMSNNKSLLEEYDMSKVIMKVEHIYEA